MSKPRRLRHVVAALAAATALIAMAEPVIGFDHGLPAGVGDEPLRSIVPASANALVAQLAAIPSGWDSVESGHTVRAIVFPVDGPTTYTDTWMAPRGGRRHLGVDMMGEKLTPLRAARTACVTSLDHESGGNLLILTDAEGWEYRYIHINNDSPGTDDGANPWQWAFAPGLAEGSCVQAGALVAYLGDSGNAEGNSPHLHFEIVRPDGVWINPYWSVKAAQEGHGVDMGQSLLAKPGPARLCRVATAPPARPDAASAAGYWLLDSTGRVHTYGHAPHLGDLRSSGVSTAPASMQATASGAGYWIVDVSGAVHAFGDADEHGDMTGTVLDGPVRRIEALPAGSGYWLVASDGGVFSFGAARFHGSMGGTPLDGPVISMTSTASGTGYWLVASDGGVFSFGDARFHGSTGGMVLDAPVIDMAVDPAGKGYWLYASDGGVFTFGALPFLGSAPGLGRCDLAPAVSMRVSETGAGYWLATRDGEILPFGDAAWFGDRPPLAERATIVDMAVQQHTASA